MDSKKGIKDLLTVGTSQFISQIIFGLFWLYLATILSKNEYGELGFLMSIANLAAVVSVLGLGGTIVVYEVKKENIFPASFLIVLNVAFLTAIITFLLYQNFSVSILGIGLAMYAFLISGLSSQKKYGLLSKYRIIRALVSIILAIILFQYIGIIGIIFGYFFPTLFILREIPIIWKRRKIEFSALRKKIKFTGFYFVNRLSTVFFMWGDKAIIGAIFGFSFLGDYHFAGQYLLLLAGIPRSVSVYLLPMESEGLENKKIKIFSVSVAIIIAIVSIFLIPHGIDFFVPEFHEAIIPAQILSIAIIPLTITSIQNTQFFGKENSKQVLVGSILQSGLYIVLIIVLGTLLGLAGIAIGLLVAATVRTIYNTVAAKFISSNSVRSDI